MALTNSGKGVRAGKGKNRKALSIFRRSLAWAGVEVECGCPGNISLKK